MSAQHTPENDAARQAAIMAVHDLELVEADPSVEQYVDAVLGALASHMGREPQKVSHRQPCGSIQCAECYPRWGDAYNAARVTSPAECDRVARCDNPACPTCTTDRVECAVGTCLGCDGIRDTSPGSSDT